MKPGLHKHYKGGWYLALLTILDVTNGHQSNGLMVLYFSLRQLKFRLRALREFDSLVYHDYKTQPRFKHIFPRVPAVVEALCSEFGILATILMFAGWMLAVVGIVAWLYIFFVWMR